MCIFSSITFFILIGLVTEAYVAISFFFSENNGSKGLEIALFASLLSFCGIMTFNLILFNSLSNKLMMKVKDLKEALIEIKSDYVVKVENENGSMVECSKNEALQFLDLFQGFDCCGFFTMGRPLLASIGATYATYSIILIQFKTS